MKFFMPQIVRYWVSLSPFLSLQTVKSKASQVLLGADLWSISLFLCCHLWEGKANKCAKPLKAMIYNDIIFNSNSTSVSFIKSSSPILASNSLIATHAATSLARIHFQYHVTVEYHMRVTLMIDACGSSFHNL